VSGVGGGVVGGGVGVRADCSLSRAFIIKG
jgi:hypothetical protein